jgi:CDP-diacylglycerol pyrophosphatase
MTPKWFVLLVGTSIALLAGECPCDHATPATLENRECSLCREAEKQTTGIFFLKDANPRKPNRTLVLPLKHGKGQQDLADLSPAERAALWKAAIAKAQELWPDAWGLAFNAETVRTQCHLHIHIGKLNEGADESGGRLISSVDDFPLAEPARGIWLHPAPGGFHVHTDREIAEPMLMR